MVLGNFDEFYDHHCRYSLNGMDHNGRDFSNKVEHSCSLPNEHTWFPWMVFLTLKLTVSAAHSQFQHFGGSVDQDESKGVVAFTIRILSHLLQLAFSASRWVYLVLRHEISNGLGYGKNLRT